MVQVANRPVAERDATPAVVLRPRHPCQDLYVVEDTRRDDGFADHPLVVGDPFIRFYAGVPLRTTDGHAIGTLEVADAVPRQLTPEQLDALRVLGRQVMAQLELRRQALDPDTSAGGLKSGAARRDPAEDALREPSVQLDAALEVAGMDVWFTNLRTGGIGRIRRGGPISRLPEGATPTTSAEFMALVHEADRAGFAARIDQATRDGVYSAEFRIVLPDGEVRWVSSRGRCLYDPDGTPSAMTGVDLDITERKRDEEQRRAAEDCFRQLAESIQQVFWMTDARGSLLYVSPAFETIFGRSCESLTATPSVWMDAVHPDDCERVEQAAYARLRRGEYDEVYRIVRPDGAVRWIATAPSTCTTRPASCIAWSARPPTSPSSVSSRSSCSRRRRWRSSAGSPAASRTTSTTC